MIASLRGRVMSVRLDSAVLEVGGVGMLVQATPGTLATLRVGSEAELHTTLIVREDSLTLYGFAETDKGAQRIVLELSDRLGAPIDGAGGDKAQAVPAQGNGAHHEQVIDALVGLGWNAKQAQQAVDAVTPDGADGADVAATLRLALRHLGRS